MLFVGGVALCSVACLLGIFELLGLYLTCEKHRWPKPTWFASKMELVDTLAVLTMMSILPLTTFMNMFGLFFFQYTYWWYAPYFFWCVIWSRSHMTGGRPFRWFRQLGLWTSYRRYFPLSAKKQNPKCEYPPNVPYLVGYHPHGIFAIGCGGQFAANSGEVQSIFPGTSFRVVTLNVFMRMPFMRDFLLSLGFVSSNWQSIEGVLNKGAGNGAVVVVGGAAEATKAVPGQHDLILLRRRGFFKLALTSGASLVPTYTFGENELYEMSKFTYGCDVVSRWAKKYWGFTLPPFVGRGLFQPALGLLPHRHPVCTIIGDPIKCSTVENPTEKQIDAVREKYCKALLQIFEENKGIYCKDSECLRFVE